MRPYFTSSETSESATLIVGRAGLALFAFMWMALMAHSAFGNPLHALWDKQNELQACIPEPSYQAGDDDLLADDSCNQADKAYMTETKKAESKLTALLNQEELVLAEYEQALVDSGHEEGGAFMDGITAEELIAFAEATGGQAARANVVLPYADRLSVFAPFLQQLCMESLGKGQALDGSAVAQGLTVYGNKGATDQHSYVQQLREGPDDHFITFVELLDITSGAAGDTLSAMLAPGV